MAGLNDIGLNIGEFGIERLADKPEPGYENTKPLDNYSKEKKEKTDDGKARKPLYIWDRELNRVPITTKEDKSLVTKDEALEILQDKLRQKRFEHLGLPEYGISLPKAEVPNNDNFLGGLNNVGINFGPYERAEESRERKEVNNEIRKPLFVWDRELYKIPITTQKDKSMVTRKEAEELLEKMLPEHQGTGFSFPKPEPQHRVRV